MGKVFRRFKYIFGKRDVMLLDTSAVKVIADMQRDLDAYHFVFGNLIGYLNGKFMKNYKPAILYGLPASKEVENDITQLCDSAFVLQDEYNKLKLKLEEYEKREIE